MIGKKEYVAYPLDEALYTLDEEEAAFFKSQTGIDDDEELKQHILRAQKDAYEVRVAMIKDEETSECSCNLPLDISVPAYPLVQFREARPTPAHIYMDAPC